MRNPTRFALAFAHATVATQAISDAENYRPGKPYRPADWRAYIATHHALDESLPPAANVSGLKDMEERLRFIRFPRVEDR